MAFKVHLLVYLAALSTAQEYCYEIRYDLANPNGPSVQTLSPIDSFPEEHPLVQEDICGVPRSPGGNITDCEWSNSGSINPGDSTCTALDGGACFYAYNYPFSHSSNTGFGKDDVLTFYFVKDGNGRVHFVVTADKPNNPDGGTLQMIIDSPSLAGQDVEITLRDDDRGDSESCLDSTTDCYAWNSTAGSGSFYHKWGSCCTDGMVLGNLPDLYTFNIYISRVTGLHDLRLGDFTNGTMSFIDIGMEVAEDAPIEVSARLCSTHCSRKQSCGECHEDGFCGWCDGLQRCLPLSEESSCTDGWEGGSCCKPCEQHQTCGTCLQQLGCEWSPFTGECMAPVCFGEGNITLLNPECATPPGPVGGDPLIEGADAFCSANGEPDFTKNTCNCSLGFFGAACNMTCPMDLQGSVCGGVGTCDSVSGSCFCPCGFGGVACNETACPCPENDGDPCSVGSTCSDECGVSTPPFCTGVGEQGNVSIAVRISNGSTCECSPAYWGSKCLDPCPGINAADGSGDVCGGHGRCDVNTGACICDDCYELDGQDGTCVESGCSSECENGGSCFCDSTGNVGCYCPGQWGGETCATCLCENEGTCNSLTGECDCPESFIGDRCQFECTREDACNGHGECDIASELCACDANYTGSLTSQCAFYCDDTTCSGNGECSPTDGSCSCNFGFVGDNCNTTDPSLQALIPTTSATTTDSTSPTTSATTSESTSPTTSDSTSPSTSPSTSDSTSPSTSDSTSPSTSGSTSPTTSATTTDSTSPSTSHTTSVTTTDSTSPTTSPTTSPAALEPGVEVFRFRATYPQIEATSCLDIISDIVIVTSIKKQTRRQLLSMGIVPYNMTVRCGSLIVEWETDSIDQPDVMSLSDVDGHSTMSTIDIVEVRSSGTGIEPWVAFMAYMLFMVSICTICVCCGSRRKKYVVDQE